MTRSFLIAAAATLESLALLGVGCSGRASSSNPYAGGAQASDVRDPALAQKLTLQAADLIATDPKKAEGLLRQALAADLYHGPAHNNLGVLYLQQDRLYDAASEFEWARKLLPGSPDPRMNLAVTLERAGRIDEALKAYAAALEAEPNHVQTMQAFARLQLREDRADGSTPDMLREIALRGESTEWRDWAKLQLALDFPTPIQPR